MSIVTKPRDGPLSLKLTLGWSMNASDTGPDIMVRSIIRKRVPLKISVLSE